MTLSPCFPWLRALPSRAIIAEPDWESPLFRRPHSAVEFVACDNPHATRLTLHILAAVAEHEREMIASRTRAALQAAKVRGGPARSERRATRFRQPRSGNGPRRSNKGPPGRNGRVRPVDAADSARANGPGHCDSARGALASADRETCDGAGLTVARAKSARGSGLKFVNRWLGGGPPRAGI
jgi:hypothetical protein